MLNGLARSKMEPERISSARKNDSEMASATGGQQEGKTNLDEDRDELHWEETVAKKEQMHAHRQTGTLPNCPPTARPSPEYASDTSFYGIR